MALFNQKVSEAGWFYHSPLRPSKSERVEVPPASQIPGLSEVGGLPYEEPPRTTIRDTDTKYIILAKQGGRPDLLKFKSPTLQPKSPVPYPRVDWYYLEDNKIEDCNASDGERKPWEFRLPEYMVHEPYTGNRSEKNVEGMKFEPKRLPYGWDKETIYNREQYSATDKTVRLPEVKRCGYGTRKAKLENSPPKKYNIPKVERGKPAMPHGNLLGSKTGNPQDMKPMYNEKIDRPIMNKLMSYGYANDWQSEMEKWQRSQEKVRQKFDELSIEPLSKEYKHNAGDNYSQQKSGKNLRGFPDRRPAGKLSGEDELWKMKKFQNVKPRTETHRPHFSDTTQQKQESRPDHTNAEIQRQE